MSSGQKISDGFQLLIGLAEIHVPRMWVEVDEEGEQTEVFTACTCNTGIPATLCLPVSSQDLDYWNTCHIVFTCIKPGFGFLLLYIMVLFYV